MNDYIWNAIIKRLGFDVAPIKDYSLDVKVGYPPMLTITYLLTDDLSETDDQT